LKARMQRPISSSVTLKLWVFCSKTDPTPIPPEFWGCSHWTRLPMLRSAKAKPEAIWPENYF